MHILQILSRHNNDFTALMGCEHCAAQSKNEYGYSDHNYYANVIPAMYCTICGKNLAGEIKPIETNTEE